jgi:hypothetical protein
MAKPAARASHPRQLDQPPRVPAERSRIRAVRAPTPRYDRRSALSRVLGLWPQEIDDESPAARQRILAKLRRALRHERQRGLAGRWTYDLARHAELLNIYREELQALAGAPHRAQGSAQHFACLAKKER